MNKVDPDLEALEAKISALKEATSTPKAAEPATAEREAIRIVSDFVAAAIVGIGLGYGFDVWQGTSPWGVVIGLMVGSAAGVRVMWQRESNSQRRNKKR